MCSTIQQESGKKCEPVYVRNCFPGSVTGIDLYGMVRDFIGLQGVLGSIPGGTTVRDEMTRYLQWPLVCLAFITLL